MSGQKIRIKIRAFDHKIIDQVAELIIKTAQDTGAIIAGPIPLPTQIAKYTVNRSTFVHKNSREQFEMRTHNRLIDIKETTSRTVDALTNLEIPAGVDIEIKMIAGLEKETFKKEIKSQLEQPKIEKKAPVVKTAKPVKPAKTTAKKTVAKPTKKKITKK
jgi:small subunit ribosomal protein S10